MSDIPPIRKEIVVEAPQERAFRVFTERFHTWWPASHHIGKSDLDRAVIEPHAGGRWYEIGKDQHETDWGKVLVWEPPRRLVLAWQISATWQYDPGLHTEVEVRFTAQGPSTTLVELEHRHLDRYGAAAAQHRGALDSEGGWAGILRGFAKTVAG